MCSIYTVSIIIIYICNIYILYRIYSRPRGKGTKASLSGSLAWKRKGHSAAAQLFRQRGGAGVKVGHVGKVNMQNLRIEAILYAGGDQDENIWLLCTVARRGWGNSAQPTWWLVIGGDSKVHLRHRSGPLEAREEVTQCKTEVEDER